MSGKRPYKSLRKLVQRFRDELNQPPSKVEKEIVEEAASIILLYAYNRTGKTRLSMEFKDVGKRKSKKKPEAKADTLYFNAFTEDLFVWENDLEGDSERHLKLNSNSKFFDAPKELNLNDDIEKYLKRYADFKFDLDYKKWTVVFSKDVLERVKGEEKLVTKENIKISRGEENIFVWCLFMAICERLADNDSSYSWVKYLYIDDPISSLDDNNAIAVACDLAKLIRRAASRKDADGTSTPVKVIFSSHHALFFNVMCNEKGRSKNGEPKVRHKRYYLHRPNNDGTYTLQTTGDTPYFHHVATLAELKRAADPKKGKLYTYHFNALRSIMEKTASFFGHHDISFCLKALDNEEDEIHFNRALNLLSHGPYAIQEPTVMVEDNQILFRRILSAFVTRFDFQTSEVLAD